MAPLPTTHRPDWPGRLLAALVAVLLALPACRPARVSAPAETAIAPIPTRLSETGLYADSATREVAASNLSFAPQYPLWTDGATKRRWIHLPPGTAIDASDPDAWDFPVGTRLWKEFAFGAPVETRLMERTSTGWRYATYVWLADGSDAMLAPDAGVRGAHDLGQGARHDIPGQVDCLSCHASAPTPVLGFSLLQLAPSRDPLAPHATAPEPEAVDLTRLLQRGLVAGMPERLDPANLAVPAATPRERAVRGYLHGNCASCHNASGPLAGLGMALDVRFGEDAGPDNLADLLGQPSTFRPRTPSGTVSTRITPGAPERSVLYLRVASRDPTQQMPPLGTHLVDDDARRLLEAWIREDLPPPPAPPPSPMPTPSSKE